MLRHAELPVQALPRRTRQEGTVVFALVPAHAVCALPPGVPTVADLAVRDDCRAGRILDAVAALINLVMGPSA